jgi:hypothetical protein
VLIALVFSVDISKIESEASAVFTLSTVIFIRLLLSDVNDVGRESLLAVNGIAQVAPAFGWDLLKAKPIKIIIAAQNRCATPLVVARLLKYE